jgi:hypothetical protein
LSQADLSGIRLIIVSANYWTASEAATDEMVAQLIRRGFSLHLSLSRHGVLVLRRRKPR